VERNRQVEHLIEHNNFDTLGKPNRIWKWNKAVVQFKAKTEMLSQLPFNTERLQKLKENYIVSNTKIKQALGMDRILFRAEDGQGKQLVVFS